MPRVCMHCGRLTELHGFKCRRCSPIIGRYIYYITRINDVKMESTRLEYEEGIKQLEDKFEAWLHKGWLPPIQYIKKKNLA